MELINSLVVIISLPISRRIITRHRNKYISSYCKLLSFIWESCQSLLRFQNQTVFAGLSCFILIHYVLSLALPHYNYKDHSAEGLSE